MEEDVDLSILDPHLGTVLGRVCFISTKYMPIPESFLNYREYSRNVALHDRKTGDPQTPVIEVKVSSRQWTDQVHNWKNALATWEDQARQANRALLTNTSLNDFDHAATFEKEILGSAS